MPQHVLAERPVILSKHKINVIIHGRPLSPIGSLRSISPYVPRQSLKESLIAEKHGDTPSITSSLDDYQKRAQDNLIAINNNLSNMLQETFSGIDCICQKVRLCLMEANTMGNIPQANCPITNPRACNKEEPNSDATYLKVQNIDNDQDQTMADLIDIFDEAPPIVGKAEPKREVKSWRSAKTGPAPFFTIVNPKAKSVESVGVKLIKSIASKLGLSRKCTAENFQKTMRKVEKMSNYDHFLSSMVDDVNKEINQCYSNCRQVGGLNNSQKNKSHRPKSSPLERQRNKIRGEFEPPLIKPVEELKKVEKNFMEDHFSDEWSKEESLGRSCRNAFSLISGKMDFTYADVYRKRAITDLHKRMLAQLEANDSLIFFQKLMKKNRKHLEQNRPRTTEGGVIMEKSPESNLFKSPLHFMVNDKRQQGYTKHKYSLTDLAQMYQDSLWFKQKKRDTRRVKEQKKHDKKATKEKLQPKTYTLRSALHLVRPKTTSQSCVNCPKAPACRCKISVTNNRPLSESDKCKIHWMRAKYVQLSHKKLKYLDILDDITKEDLIPLNPEYPRRDQMCKTCNVKETYLYKLLHGKGQENQHAWSELLKPCDEESNIKTQQLHENPADACQIASKLSKYIFAEPETKLPHSKVFTVMPVHVFYNSRIGVSSKRADQATQKLPLIPMKETKEIRKAEWAQEGKKLKPIKMVYDPILRKIDKDIRLITATSDNNKKSASLNPAVPTSWQPKNSHHIQESTRTSLGSQKQVCPLGINGGTAPSVAEIFKSSRVGSTDHKSTEKADIKRKIQKDLEARLKTEHDRKIWENKYGKTVGQKLLSFIEKQPAAYQVPTPKYALPKPVKNSSTQQQIMLEHLKSLKQKNDYIQTNIQKAIAVIEDKMADILGKPATSHSIEAFDEMEKEISSVLNMMMKPQTTERSRKKEKRPKIDEYVNDVDKISEELFKKLDKILESPGTTSSERSSKISLAKWQKHKFKHGNSGRNSDMNQVCFSSTPATGGEKFTVTAISPKRASKTSIVSPYIPNSERSVEEVLGNNSELKKLKTELKLNEELLEPEDLRVLESIDESKVSIQDTLEKATIVPIKEQLVNLALMDLNPAKKELSAGDQPVEPNTAEAEDPSYSLGDGDSLSQPNIQGTRLHPKELNIQGEDVMKKELQEVQQCKVVYQEAVLVEDVADISEQFFTPRTSPLGGIRKIQLSQTILPNQEESTTPEVIVKTTNSDPNQSSSEDNNEQDSFYQNVNRIISRAESVYNQLEEFDEVLQQLPSASQGKIMIFQDTPKVEEVEADSFLTPFMHAVKDLRKCTPTEETVSAKTSPRMHRSPSYFNVLTFLDTLTDFKEERPIEVRTSRLVWTAFLWYIPATVHFTSLECLYTTGTFESLDVPKKKSGCLKNPSSHLNMSTCLSKSRQKVSFLLQKEEKATQVTVCAFHAPKDVQEVNSDISNQYTSKVDEQVSAYLDAEESKSLDLICQNEDENTYQSTLEISDEISLDKNQMPDSFGHCVNNVKDTKKNIVELFRNSCPEEQGIEKVKVFYDNYQKGQQTIDSKLISGFYNEKSLLQVAESLDKDISIKKRHSLQRLSANSIFVKESALFEPLKNVNKFIDSSLLKKAIEERQKIRTMGQIKLCEIRPSNLLSNGLKCEVEQSVNEGLLKGIYIFVYFLMFTALNLEYKCLQ